MKNLSCLTLILMVATIGYAQTEIPQKGEYRKDDKLDKFVGTWEGAKGDESLKIILKKEKVYIKQMDIHMDLIIGWHVYTKNNQVVENSIDFAGGGYDENTTITGSSEGDDTLSISGFHDLSRKRTSGGKLILTNNNKGVLSLWFKEQVLINKKPATPAVAIPTPSEWNMKRIK